MEEIENKMKKLIDELNYYTKLYDEGHPVISDKEWDNMYFQLVQLENENNIYYKDSPTQRVNYQVVNKLNKVKKINQESFENIVSSRKPYGLCGDVFKNCSKYKL